MVQVWSCPNSRYWVVKRHFQVVIYKFIGDKRSYIQRNVEKSGLGMEGGNEGRGGLVVEAKGKS
jgi:hypothetical protein